MNYYGILFHISNKLQPILLEIVKNNSTVDERHPSVEACIFEVFMNKRIYFLLTCITLCACATGSITKKTGISEIRFGQGGGFTGEIKTYLFTAEHKLLENNKVLKRIDSRKTLALFNLAKEIKDYKFNEPENMYSFIEIKTKDKTNRIVWSATSSTVDKRVVELYKELLAITK